MIITTGSQQGLDLIARVLLEPGDVVLVELPSLSFSHPTPDKLKEGARRLAAALKPALTSAP